MNEIKYDWKIILTDKDSQALHMLGEVSADTFMSAVYQAIGEAFAHAKLGIAGEVCKGPYRIIHLALTRHD